MCTRLAGLDGRGAAAQAVRDRARDHLIEQLVRAPDLDVELAHDLLQLLALLLLLRAGHVTSMCVCVNMCEHLCEHVLRLTRSSAILSSADCCVPASTRSRLESCIDRSLMNRPVFSIVVMSGSLQANFNICNHLINSSRAHLICGSAPLGSSSQKRSNSTARTFLGEENRRDRHVPARSGPRETLPKTGS